jgi:ferredoxin
MLYFSFMEEGEEKDRKKEKEEKSHLGEGGIPRGWTHLANCAAGCSC